MKFKDLNKLFTVFLKNTVEENSGKYPDAEALENDLAVLNEKFENTAIDGLEGLTPKEYAAALAKEGRLFDYVADCLDKNIELSDIVLDEVVNADGAVEFLNGLLYENNFAANMLGVSLLAERGGGEAEDIFIKLLTLPDIKDEIKTAAYIFLSEAPPRVADKILELINGVPESGQGILTEILSNYKGRKEVFYRLVTMLHRADDVPLYAKLLGSYGDPAAADILKSFAAENDINYIEFIEIRNAVEMLGGELSCDKDFSDDPYFKYMHPSDN